MQITDEMVLAAAKSDYAFDNRGDWDRASRIDRERYCQRSHAALTAALGAMWRPVEEAPDNEVVLVCGFASAGYYVADARKIDGHWMLFDQYNDDFTVESSGHTHFMPLPSPPAQEGR